MKKGDILVSLWGHAYVNVDFYEVLRTTAKYVFFVALLSHREKIHYMHTRLCLFGGVDTVCRSRGRSFNSVAVSHFVEFLHRSVQGYGKEALNLDRTLSSSAGQSLHH